MTEIREVARFDDKYGEERVIHKTRHGLKVQRKHATPILAMNPVIGEMFGRRVKARREELGLTLDELARRIGVVGGHPKNRMWEIENAVRREGVRMGTMYALAMALGCEVWDLLPDVAEVAEECRLGQVEVSVIGSVA